MLDFSAVDPVVLAVAIFFARIVDVSLSTFRTIMVFRGHRPIAATIGFFEVVIWIVAASSVIANLDNWYLVVAYAAGFATGNYIGMVVESRVAIGAELVRVISSSADRGLAEALRCSGWAPVAISGCNSERAPVDVVLIVAPRRRIRELLAKIRELDPGAACTTSDVRIVPGDELRSGEPLLQFARLFQTKRK